MDAALSVIFGLHSVTSVSLTLLNKQLTAEIPFPWTIVLLQCLASVPVTLLANVQFRQIKAIKLSHFPGAMLISTLFVLCLTSSLVGLSRVHIPMVVVGKNLGPFCTALLEALILKAPLNPRTLGSLLLGVVGSTFYAMGDANSDARGVGLVGLNALLVALTSVSEKHVVRTLDQAALGFSLYRNILAIPLLLATICAGMEDISDAALAFQTASSSCWVVFAASTIFSSAAGLLVFTLQGRVSATTTQIASLCYKLATTVLSLVVFPKARKDLGWMAVVGYGLSTVSVALYAFLPSPNSTKRVADKDPDSKT
ncbi:unnamed protein product [Effrenium voratum]|uniref:Sugar phosphate transporter domain-containing protein n=1 Tax=Effrenium voratum TaxID=2562239 RepID=A0AA36IJX9_9DINO|nr:unnamed protein product [Effrenium voratum]CAJ1389173.1 unnamed protein product [Effrenium voratum]